ncbi:MAG: Type IV pilus assembly protein PilM [Parcubacteria group bacterium GW2011_GWE2_38_18]|nr:MAG: Type IV pilus assembly protein PilM [Parcubacteria group bacterium GW2011_GWE2_38_18]
MGLFKASQGYLGIDIGTSSIKIVELKKEGNRPRLSSYGFSEGLDGKLNNDWQLNVKKTAKAINKICKEAGMTSKSAVAALPTYSVFSSILNLSNVDKKDIASTVHWEAKKVIPIPLDEIILDWKKIEEDDKINKKSDNYKVLITGAPKLLVKKYIDIFKEAQINLISLETEVFSLSRSLLGRDKSTVAIVEIGTNTTNISIIDKGIPMLNRSIDIGGLTITKSLANNLNIGLERAEQFKYDLGMNSLTAGQEIVPKTIIEALNPVINEIKYVLNLYQNRDNKKVEKIILSGGSSLLVNFVNYLSKILDINVIIGDPWARVSCPVELKPVLDEVGPRMSIAVGLALRQME